MFAEIHLLHTCLTKTMYRCIIQDKPKQISMCYIVGYSEGTRKSETFGMVFEASGGGWIHSRYGTDGKLIDGVQTLLHSGKATRIE